jgi:hypothetical protein
MPQETKLCFMHKNCFQNMISSKTNKNQFFNAHFKNLKCIGKNCDISNFNSNEITQKQGEWILK